MSNIKNITLLAYDIENEDLSPNYSDLFDNLKQKLGQGEIADNRRMKLNSESTEEDLLSDFAVAQNYIYGVMWRIAPSKEIPRIPDGLFKNPKIQINDIRSNDEKFLLTCKEHYYFAVNKKFLITSLPKTRIKSLQVYLNWLLEAYRGEKRYNFISKIKTPENTKLSEIKYIVFKSSNEEKEEKADDILSLVLTRLRKIIAEDTDLSEILENRVFKAKLQLDISKPRKMDDANYKKLLGTYMNPISDTDGISYKLENGKTISGTNILQSKTVCIEMIDDGKISEQNLIQEMQLYLNELNNLP